MGTILVLIGIVIVSMFVVKIGSVAYRMTGLDKSTASFQALSAFSGTGFTTREAELIVNNPRRRNITKVLMIIGNAGIASVVATLVLSFSGKPDWSNWRVLANVLILLAGLFIVYQFAVAKWLQSALDKFIANRLGGVRYLGIPEFQEVIGLTKDYGISSIVVKPDSRLAGRTLEQLHLGQVGVLVLAIHRGRELISSPVGSTRIEANDRLVCYGSLQAAKDVTVAHKPEADEADDPPDDPQPTTQDP
ncbi:MAG: TrkA C-terminal domain-containing protein [Planctomycetes bacterium]|nr:TrkA C-terminal domain-containing protein [Planctomycetota bacterium]